MEKLNIEQIHNCCLKIAIELDKTCVKYNIPYYMLGGTMLGAIRHKGFIPWDDDMDFGIPRPYFETALNLLKKELPYFYKVRTYKDCDQVLYPFAKIEDTRTIIDGGFMTVPIEKRMGINIDIFPLDYTNNNNISTYKAIYKLMNLQTKIFVDSTEPKWHKTFLKKVLRSLVPFSYVTLPKKIDNRLANIEHGYYLANVCGRWKEREIIPVEWYGDNEKYTFENYNFTGIKEYDCYLTQLYGDYMKLPPEDKRYIHFDNVYLK